MENIKVWLGAFRLRTLPLSLSGIVLGSFFAMHFGYWNTGIFLLSISTTILLQILSNLANDLGDHLKGTDNENRVGPMRATQSGAISAQQMKKAVILFSLLSALSAGSLIYIAGKEMSADRIWTYIFLGIAAVVAALMYTLGKRAYGYLGLGDIFVFVFFGLVSVYGVYGLHTAEYSQFVLIGGAGIGFLSTAVLNLNNLRDHQNDAIAGKNTVIVKMGFQKGKIYHALLICLAFTCFFILSFWLAFFVEVLALFSLLLFAPLFVHVKKVYQTKNPRDLDPELKKVALNTFAIALVFGILMNL